MSEGAKSYWDFIEPRWDIFNIHDGPEAFEASIREAPRPVVLLYAAHFCQSEVNNGGFLQFFWNNTGVLAPEAIEGYRVIGMPMMASLLEAAALCLGTPYPRKRDDRWDALLVASGQTSRELKETFEKQSNLYLAFAEATKGLPFDSLDKQFWAAAKTENGGFEAAATHYAQSPFLIQQGTSITDIRGFRQDLQSRHSSLKTTAGPSTRRAPHDFAQDDTGCC